LGRHFETTPLPQLTSLMTIYGNLFSHNRKTETIILTVNDFCFLPRSLSTSKSAKMTEQGVPPTIPLNQICVTPRLRREYIILPSAAGRITHNGFDMPVQSVVLETHIAVTLITAQDDGEESSYIAQVEWQLQMPVETRNLTVSTVP
jgi:hypothetical protein